MYKQKVCYIDMYKNGIKCGNMGHVRVEWEEGQYCFGANLCRLDRQTIASVMIRRNGVEVPEKLQDIEVIHGKGHYRSDWIPMWGDENQLIFEASGGVVGVCTLPEMWMQEKEIMIRQDSGTSIACETEMKTTDIPESESVQEQPTKEEKQVQELQQMKEEKQVRKWKRKEECNEVSKIERRDMLEEIRREREALSSMPLMDNKWKQLCSMYESVRPVAGDMEFIKIKPEDFIILRQEYQGLVRNSFLLHGYYNYHYILLGKYPDKYYLGVPGILHEQERLAAAMFGFVGFERAIHVSESETDGLDFGYYMMEVAI